MNTDYVENNTGVPSFAKRETYNFDATKDSLEVYRELNEIAEEIERCRLRNC